MDKQINWMSSLIITVLFALLLTPHWSVSFLVFFPFPPATVFLVSLHPCWKKKPSHTESSQIHLHPLMIFFAPLHATLHPSSHAPFFLCLQHSSALRCPATCACGVFGARVGPSWRSFFRQAAAVGEAIWTVQPSEHTAPFPGSGLYCLWYQVLGTFQPRCLLGRLSERGTARGTERSLHHRLFEKGSGAGGGPAACQCGSGWLRGGQEAVGQKPDTKWDKLGNTKFVSTFLCIWICGGFLWSDT